MYGRIERLRPEEATGCNCLWVGCGEEYDFKEGVDADHPPADWRLIVVAKGSLFERKNILTADVDGALCPKHYRELLCLLKIGGLIEGIG